MIKNIGILSPGNMGAAVGRHFKTAGYEIVTALKGRSEYTKRKAKKEGFRDVKTLDVLVDEVDLILSILDPGKAQSVACQVAQAIKATGSKPIYADCNAISPRTAKELQVLIENEGGTFVDVGIIGGAPTRRDNFPNFCISGPKALRLEELDGKGIKIKYIGPDVGQGSAIKICNGAYNKGAFALYATVMLAAEHYGFTEFLRERLPRSQAANIERLDEALIRLPTLSERYVGEMEQVSETFSSIGLTPNIHKGAADLFEMLSGSPLASQRRDEIDPQRTSAETLKVLAEQFERDS